MIYSCRIKIDDYSGSTGTKQDMAEQFNKEKLEGGNKLQVQYYLARSHIRSVSSLRTFSFIYDQH